MHAVSFHMNADDDRKVVRLALPPRFDHTVRRHFRDACLRAEDGYSFVVDFASTTYVDSSGLGMLLLLKERGGPVSLVNVSPTVRDLLAVVRFDQLFQFD